MPSRNPPLAAYAATILAFAAAFHASAQRALVIGIDGLSPLGIHAGETPNFDRVIREGARSFTARAVLPTSSSSNWASMIMGAGPSVHGITSNDWQPWNSPLEPAAKADDGLFPNIFSQARAAKPDAVIGVAYDWGGFARLYPRSIVDLDHDGNGPDETTRAATDFIVSARPDLTFVHLDHVDHAGHAHGWFTPQYVEAVEHADRLVGELLDALDQAGLSSETTVIITSDHGGKGTGHGGETMGELLIPWMILGPDVASGRRITRPINTFDTACTVAHIMGIPQNDAWTGRPVVEAFISHAGAGFDLAEYVPSPIIAPAAGLYDRASVDVEITRRHPRSRIHFTTDGSTPTRQSQVYAGPITIHESASIRAIAITRGGESGVASADYRIIRPDAAKNIRYRYYEGQWEQLPAFGSLTPVSTGTVADFELALVKPRDDHFAVVFETTLEIKEPGDYTFYTTSDDGSALYINNRKVVDNDGTHGFNQKSGRITLRPGTIDLRIEYFESTGGNDLRVAYEGPGFGMMSLPTEHLQLPNG